VVVVDLDRFKAINDRAGTWAATRCGAARLPANLRSRRGHGARLGGDEFGLILLDRRPRSWRPAAEDFHLRPPLGGGGRAIPVSVSIGACLYPRRRATHGSLQAPTATYEAKRRRRLLSAGGARSAGRAQHAAADPARQVIAEQLRGLPGCRWRRARTRSGGRLSRAADAAALRATGPELFERRRRCLQQLWCRAGHRSAIAEIW
jgi:GGDEF domain-containing protein